MINFLDHIWNVTTQNSTLNNFKGNRNIYYENGRSYYTYEYPISYITKAPFTIILQIIQNSINFFSYFKNSTYSNKILLDQIFKNSRNPTFLIGLMGGSSTETFTYFALLAICNIRLFLGYQLFVYN